MSCLLCYNQCKPHTKYNLLFTACYQCYHYENNFYSPKACCLEILKVKFDDRESSYVLVYDYFLHVSGCHNNIAIFKGQRAFTLMKEKINPMVKATSGPHHLKIRGFNQQHYSITNIILIINTCNRGISLDGIMLSTRSDIEPDEV